jgi:beta-phosphoglucomutase-like phosphatase (HAD superfamily)
MVNHPNGKVTMQNSPKGRLGVIFDVDGVLLDSYKMHYECWRAIAEKHSITVSEKEFDSLFGRRGSEIVRQIWGEDLPSEQVASIHRSKQALYRENLRRHFPEMEGAIQLIDGLAGERFVLGIGSSAPSENVEMSLNGLQRAKSFKAVVTGSDVIRGKPDPQVFLLAAQRMEVEPSNCAVIEDAPAGIAAALAGGMTAVALAGTAPPERLTMAHLVVNSLRQLTPKQITELILRRHSRG